MIVPCVTNTSLVSNPKEPVQKPVSQKPIPEKSFKLSILVLRGSKVSLSFGGKAKWKKKQVLSSKYMTKIGVYQLRGSSFCLLGWYRLLIHLTSYKLYNLSVQNNIRIMFYLLPHYMTGVFYFALGSGVYKCLVVPRISVPTERDNFFKLFI